DQGVQAAVGRGRLLARGLEQADAHARVRDGVLLAQGPQGLRGADRTGASERPPQARTAAGAVRVLRCLPRRGVWLPAGTEVFNSLVALSREMGRPHGYTEVKTPQLFDSSLWKISGHWDKYRDNMFVTEYEDRAMALKPMNCPGHCQLFSLQRHSYRDLPVRYSEPGLLHRREPSGTLHGLLRVRHFAQDDGHVFCTGAQRQDELAGCLEFAFATYAVFGIEVRLELSTRPEERLGSDEQWDRAEGALIHALEAKGLEYDLNEGDGSFYGPKIDLH